MSETEWDLIEALGFYQAHNLCALARSALEKPIRKAVRLTVKTGREHGFPICAREGGVRAGEMVQGTEEDIAWTEGKCPAGWEPVGFLHTHPSGAGPSPRDLIGPPFVGCVAAQEHVDVNVTCYTTAAHGAKDLVERLVAVSRGIAYLEEGVRRIIREGMEKRLPREAVEARTAPLIKDILANSKRLNELTEIAVERFGCRFSLKGER